MIKTALCKELCLVCGKQLDGPIIMNSKLTAEHANKVKQLHNQVVGFAENFCEDCTKYSEESLPVIMMDPDQSGNTLESIYRTGQIAFIKNDSDFVKSIPENMIYVHNGHKVLFMDIATAKQIGIIE